MDLNNLTTEEKIKLSKDPNTPIKILEELVAHIKVDPNELWPRTIFTLDRNKIASFIHYEELYYIASNPNINLRILEEISSIIDVNDYLTKDSILTNPNCSEELKTYLIAKQFINNFQTGENK
jgi:hypothetical protein